MLDITPYLELKSAPHAVFDALEERRSRPRFMVPTGDGDYRAVTWGSHADSIRRAALFLAAAGFEAGERAAVFAPNRVEWMAAALAIQSAGGVMVPIYPASTAEQAAYVAEHSDARFVFVDTAALLGRIFSAWSRYANVERIVLLDDALDAAEVLAGLRKEGRSLPGAAEVEKKIVSWSRVQALGAARDAEQPGEFQARLDAISLDAPGMMLYTSGTTGNPKGVPLTHRNVGVNGRDWLSCNAPLLDEQGVDLLWLPMSHIFGFGEACLGNTLGFTTYLSEPASVLGELPRVRPNVFMSVPAYWEKLAMQALSEDDRDRQRAKLGEITGGRLKFCLSGGAGLKREVKELFYNSGLLIIEGYGLSECSPTLTLNRPGEFRFDSVGKPLPSVELKLADDGEILARGESVFSRLPQRPGVDARGLHRRRLAEDRRRGALHRGRLPADHRSQEGDPGHGGRQERAAGEHRDALRRRPALFARCRVRRRQEVPGRRRVARPGGDRRGAVTPRCRAGRSRQRALGAGAGAHRSRKRTARPLRADQALRDHGHAAHGRRRPRDLHAEAAPQEDLRGVQGSVRGAVRIMKRW